MRWTRRPPGFNPMKWHRWFAWYPVRLEEEMLWWEFIERRSVHRVEVGWGIHMVSIHGWWQYREDGNLEIEEAMARAPEMVKNITEGFARLGRALRGGK